ncbi:MAG TPA: AzlC family ABC transporter permease [Acidimicrobiia bacterium]|nr:AzlC family ABC transporter permease [Acidimicrobiia bacterium]
MSVDRAVVRRGIIDSLPLYVPALPFALIIGLAIVEAGVDPFVGWSGSWLIFGGAAQLVVVSLLGSGAAAFAIVTAGLVIQARHLMYSAALAPTFQAQPAWFRWVGPYFLVDQIFALTVIKDDDDPNTFRTYYLSAAITLWFLWLVTTAVGLAVGPVVPEEWNLGFAVPLLFIGLLVVGMGRFSELAAALVGAAVTFAFASLPNRTGLLVGSLAGIAVGTIVERVRK